MISTEHVVSNVPFVVRRRVKWAECDPAGVVYTAVFSEYVMSAVELFYEFLFDAPPHRGRQAHGLDTPTRALEFDFRKSLRPGEKFDLTVSVRDVRTRSYTLGIVARTPRGGEDVFHAVLAPICVTPGERRAIGIPQSLRTSLEDYRARCLAATDPLQSTAPS